MKGQGNDKSNSAHEQRISKRTFWFLTIFRPSLRGGGGVRGEGGVVQGFAHSDFNPF